MGDHEKNSVFFLHAEHYLQVLREAESLYLGYGDLIPQGKDMFEAEWANIERGQAWAAANYGNDPSAAKLCKEYPSAGARLLFHRLPNERISWLRSAVDAAQSLNDFLTAAAHLERLATEYFDLEHIDDEIGCELVLADLSKRMRDDHKLKTVLVQLAGTYVRNKQPVNAVACLSDALTIIRRLGLRGEEGLLLAKLGRAHLAANDYLAAAEYLQQALVGAQQSNIRRRQAETLFDLAAAYHGLKRQGEAITFAAEAALLYDQLQDSMIETVKRRLRQWRTEAHYSCFISYSSRDHAFAVKLHTDLEKKDVRCWFAPEDMKIGDQFRRQIDESIRRHDKLLLILSGNSIESPWVEDEVEAALERERIERRLILFPIRVDEAIMQTTQPWAAHIRQKRHIGDFRSWPDDVAYEQALNRLLRDLRMDMQDSNSLLST